MGAFLLCQTDDLVDDEPLECEGPDGAQIAVVRHQGRIYAFDAECPHQGSPLADGEIADGTIQCALHFWTWRLADGAPTDDDTELPLQTYPVVARDGGVWLDAA